MSVTRRQIVVRPKDEKKVEHLVASLRPILTDKTDESIFDLSQGYFLDYDSKSYHYFHRATLRKIINRLGMSDSERKDLLETILEGIHSTMDRRDELLLPPDDEGTMWFTEDNPGEDVYITFQRIVAGR